MAMQLNAPNFESPWLDIQPVGTPEMPYDQSFREMVRGTGAEEPMWKWLPRISGAGTSFEAYSEHVMKLTQKKKFFPVVIFRKSDHAYMGGAAFVRVNRTHRNVEIGFVWLHEGFREWVYFAAVQEAMIRRAMAWRAKRIVWQVAPQNDRMLRALDRLGAKQEGVLRSVYRMNDGRWSDIVLLSIVRDEIKRTVDRLREDLEHSF